MITYSLTPTEMTVGKKNRVTFTLVNTSHGTCTGIVLYLGFPTEINLIDGWREVKESRLGADESKSYQLAIIGKQAGLSYLEILSMSYFEPDGSKVKLSGEKIPIEILEQEQPAIIDNAITLSQKVFKYEQWDVLEGIIKWQGDNLSDNVCLQTYWPLECRESFNIERLKHASEHPFRLYVRPMELGEHVPVKITLNGTSGITLYEQSISLHVVQEVNIDQNPFKNKGKQISQELERGVIRLFNREGNTVGTGFVIDEQLAVTCAHVAALALENAPITVAGRIRIQFNYGKSRHIAELVKLDTGADDVAFLRLAQLPEGVTPLKLTQAGQTDGHKYASLGYPKDSGPAANRKPRGLINGVVDAKEQGRQPLLELKGEEFYYGSSGSPVLDLDCDGVVGMVTNHNNLEYTKLVYATTADTIEMYWPKLTTDTA